MKFVRSLLNLLLHIGVDPNTTRMCQREVILSNKISLFLLPLTALGMAVSYFNEVYFTTIGFGLFFIFLLCVFLLNKSGASIIARFGLSVLPQLFLLLPNVLSGIGKEENFLGFSHIFIGLSFIPLLLFHKKKDRNILVAALGINLLFILFFDAVLAWSGKNEIDIQMIEDNYIFYKLPQLILWILMVSGFQFLKRENFHFEKSLKESNNSMIEFSNEIQVQNEEIVSQNEMLNEKQLEIEKQNHKLANSNNELNNTKIELLKNIELLIDARDKLSQKEAEAKSILDALNEHYLIAQYDLEGNLVSINTKVVELLGVVRNELFKNIEPIINQVENTNIKQPNGHYFSHVWKKIISGEAQTIKLEFNIGGKVKSMATTFAPLFGSNNKPYKILAIGQDISELIEKNEKIDKINEELKEKISEISQQNEVLNFQQMEIFETSEELLRQKEEIQSINESLEIRVQERTGVLEAKNKQLAEYAFINSHVLRSPVSTMMGLINLISYANLQEEDKKIYEHLKETAQVLDSVVFKINSAIDNGIHFDRNYLEPERDFLPMDKN